MTRLILNARNMLVQVPEVLALIEARQIGRGKAFSDGWIFANTPHANIEAKSYQALVVLTFGGTWQEPNGHNTARFPRMYVDVWASPTRKADGTPERADADYLIEDVMAAMLPYLHTVDAGVPGSADHDPTLPFLGRPGQPRMWGTAAQIASRTGSLVMSSELLGEPEFSDVRDGNGARMGRYSFGVHTA